MSFAKSLLHLRYWALAMSLISPALYAADQLDFEAANFAATLHASPAADVSNVPLDAKQTADLQLEQFSVFSPTASIVVKSATDSKTLPLPSTRYFKGKISDRANSAAFMAVDTDGKARSVVQLDGQLYVNNSSATAESAPNYTARAVHPEHDFKQKSFSCGVDGNRAFKPPLPAGISAKLKAPERAEASNGMTYYAGLIIETDYEFYQLFNDSAAAAQYVADLIAYVSSIYEAEINTQLRIEQLVLYTSPQDPWDAESTSGALYELQSYYLANRSQAKRTAVHFLSGKENMNGGIAFISSICTAPAYGGSSQGTYDYGVSGGMSGRFTANSPYIVWDAYVVAHELGHNFGSAHTHAYDVDHGYNLPVDCCYSSSGGACQNYTRASELPGLGTLTGGSTTTHPGTIMSYCHLVSGGSQNLSMTFGMNHPYGVQAYRVPAQMRATVETYAASYPACLATGNVSHTPFTLNNLSKWHESYVAKESTPLIGDFNGDGRDDVASFAQYSSHKVFVSLSTGTSLAAKTLWKPEFALGTEEAAVGDFNGDGKADLISLTHNDKRQLHVALSTGASFSANELWFTLKTAQDGIQVVGDFDGDTKDDVATIQKVTGEVFVSTSTGKRFRVQNQWSLNALLGAEQIVVGDFNGDKRADLGFSTSTGEVKVSLSSGTSFAASQTWHSDLAKSAKQLAASDFNQDGKDDIVSYQATAEGGIYVAFASDNQFGDNQHAHKWFAPYDQIIKAGYFTNDKVGDVISFTRGTTADVWVATDLP